jgi:tripartite-type tricarboxylate transporter receptor subunit TctC
VTGFFFLRRGRLACRRNVALRRAARPAIRHDFFKSRGKPLIYDRQVANIKRNRSGQPRAMSSTWAAWLLLLLGIAGSGLASAAKPAQAEAISAPVGAIKLFVPFNPGGEADGSARNFLRSAARFSSGEAMETLYLTAESGAAASRAVRTAAPDGRTLLLGRVGSLAILPALSPQTAVPVGDFTVLAVLDQSPLICAVRSGSSIMSMHDLLAKIAAAPGQLRYSTAGPGTLQNLAVRYLLALSGLAGDAARPLHFTQGTLATQALLNGEVDFVCNNARSVIPRVQSGELRGLMTTAQGRLKQLPRMQNAAELGLRDMQQLQGWSALIGPGGMPAQVVSRWRAVLDHVADDPEWQAGTEALGALARIHAVDDPALYVRQQARFYERLAATLGGTP